MLCSARSIKTDELDVLIKGAKSLGVESGEVVIQQGESGDHYYVVARGTFVVRAAHRSRSTHCARSRADRAGEGSKG